MALEMTRSNAENQTANVSTTVLTFSTSSNQHTTGGTNGSLSSTAFSSTSSFLYTTHNSTVTPVFPTNESNCLRILYEDIGTSNVRIWDVMLFVPNLLFALFVIYRMRRVWHRILSGIGSGGSPIFISYFVLVALAAISGVIRGIVSMTVDVTTTSGSDANKVLWVILRFFLLMVELSVLVFGIAFGRLDSKASVARVLAATTSVAFIYSAVQCTLELVSSDPRFEISTTDHSVYGHGGSLFCFVTSLIFLLMYMAVAMLPFIKWMQKYLSVPTRKSFYMYVVVMATLYFTATIGCALLLFGNSVGLCILDFFSIAYFTLSGPLIYWAFLSSYFGNTQPSGMLFSYATQVDEGLADVADFDYQGNGITVDSTLSGILVFNHGPDESAQLPPRPKPRPASPASMEESSATLPSSDSTHSFIPGPR